MNFTRVRVFAPPFLKRATRTALRAYGIQTAGRRPLPDFLLVGTKRGGTTSLWNYLASHPLVLPLFPSAQNIKSPAYFFEHWWRGTRWYRSHFPTESVRERVARRLGQRPLAGDASPYYMYDPRVAGRLRDELPDVKIVVQLRDPVARAYSHHGERVNARVEPLSFRDALAVEERRTRGEVERMLADPTYYSRPHDWYSYRDRGVYLTQVERLYESFPAEQILVLRSEDLYENEQTTFDRVTDFLGLTRHDLGRPARHNYRPRSSMDPDVREALEAFYRPHVERLEAFLGREFDWTYSAEGR